MNRFVVVDFETTGSHPRNGDSIIQIGAVVIDDGQITECFSTLVNPGQAIPAYITQLTGITDDMVVDAPTLEEVFPRFLRMLDGRTFVAHNASFDLQFLQEALLSQGYYTFDGYVLDTVELSRFLLPTQNSYRLGELADDLQIEHDRPHQADSDALATAQLFLHLLEILQQLPLVTIQRLQLLVSSFRSDIHALLRYMELEKLSASALTEADRTRAVDESDLWDIYRQLALRKREDKEGVPQIIRQDGYERKEIATALEELIGEQAALGRTVPGYQRREAQEAMMRAIYDAMHDGAHLLVEAGTGTGKSLAYLLPSILWSKWNREQVVVSTHTIHLQEQLFHKEIPALQQSLPFSFTAATLKGRGNYLCLRKFEHSLEETEEGSSQELRLVKGQMLTWLTQTTTGDVEELSLPPSGTLFWQQVKSDSGSCLHRNCPWFSRCYYFQAKERAKDADLLIVNHALLISDLEADSRILPPYSVAVIDEAHHLEEIATQHLGIHYSTTQLHFLIDRLSVEANSTLQQFAEELVEWQAERREEADKALRELARKHITLREAALQWTQLLYHWAAKRGEETTDVGRETVRYNRESFTGRNERIVKTSKQLIQLLAEYGEQMERLLKLTPAGEKPPFAFRSLRTDLSGMIQDLQQAADSLHVLLVETDGESVFWMEVEARTHRKQVYLFAAPLEVSHALSKRLFAEKRSLILTSATLTVKQSFAFIMERYGLTQLPEERVRTLSLPSPFEYDRQGLLLIPSQFPMLGKENEESYLQAIVQGCVDVVRAAGGRTMILFTSYSMLRQVYQGMKELLANEPYQLLGHGIDSGNRSKLVRLFQRQANSVLLGTSSFWEGVDIPGEALSCLVIVRLPFTPPNHPVYEGRAERLKQMGKNAFMSMALPQAVIQFKQGVGRLIRHHMDRGVIVVFDTRIVESRYGRAFLQSLPAYRTETGPWPQLRDQIEPFLHGMQSSPDS
ncbi:ATP-dependent DNA helicase DinG [Brevibacillus sp. H7]|uniref:ATP-dependent DNA helicase DinG n=1 Tax=Brevibacillus sp. H7 TaxID=3349138 RepID=UPI0038019C7F